MIFHTVVACVRMRITPLDLWKRTLPTFFIAITTASSSAAFTSNIKTCTEELGVSHRLANFGVPFGQILYKPGVSVLFLVAVFGAAESSGTEVSLSWYITAVLICIILSLAAPPVAGGMSASFNCQKGRGICAAVGASSIHDQVFIVISFKEAFFREDQISL